jgi:hypothetical protein
MQQSLHEFIFDNIKDTYLKSKYGSVDTPINELVEKDLYKAVFYNYRKSNNKHLGLRLTYIGEMLMKKHFVEYKYELKKRPTNKVFIMLDKYSEWPYYIGNKYVSFFSQDDAAWFRLNNSDLEDYIEQL